MRSSKIWLKSYLFHMRQFPDCVSYEKFVDKCPTYCSIDVLVWKCQLSSIVQMVKTQVQSQNHKNYFRFSYVYAQVLKFAMQLNRIELRVNPLFTEKYFDIGNYIFKFILLRQINECILFQGTNLSSRISIRCEVISLETINTRQLCH